MHGCDLPAAAGRDLREKGEGLEFDRYGEAGGLDEQHDVGLEPADVPFAELVLQ